jgi:sulfur relay (sulfurtransferase) DsrC/TusE family protein
MASQKVRKMKNQKNNILKLLKDFVADSRKQGFLRDHQHWLESSETLNDAERLAESTPHLAFFAFIQKYLNGHMEEISR